MKYIVIGNIRKGILSVTLHHFSFPVFMLLYVFLPLSIAKKKKAIIVMMGD
jgi:hypothetical protein